jgi:bacterioferritin
MNVATAVLLELWWETDMMEGSGMGDIAGAPGDRKRPFLADIKAIRDRARQHMADGAVTAGYGKNPQEAFKVLNEALATELICVLRYKRHSFMAAGIYAEPIAREFATHATEEAAHADAIARRIVQLGGAPDFSPDGLSSRAHADYVEGQNLKEMIEENLVAERIAIDTYREMARWFGEDDPTTRRLLEGILEQEEEHADELSDLLHKNPL